MSEEVSNCRAATRRAIPFHSSFPTSCRIQSRCTSHAMALHQLSPQIQPAKCTASATSRYYWENEPIAFEQRRLWIPLLQFRQASRLPSVGSSPLRHTCSSVSVSPRGRETLKKERAGVLANERAVPALLPPRPLILNMWSTQYVPTNPQLNAPLYCKSSKSWIHTCRRTGCLMCQAIVLQF